MARSNSNSLRNRVRLAAEANPNSTPDEIAAILGEDRTRVSNVASASGIRLRRLSKEEYAAAHRGRMKPPNYYGKR